MLEVGKILVLSDEKEYVVVSTTVLDNKNYVYLICKDDYTNFMFCEHLNNKLITVTDEIIIDKLLMLFRDNLNNTDYLED